MKIKLLGLSICATIVALSSCGGAAPTEKEKGFPRIHYDLQPGVKTKDLQGRPWINSNLPGMTAKVKQPSLKDDFYASVNYEQLVNNDPGQFDRSSINVSNELYSILTEDTEVSNSELLQKANSDIYSGDTSDLRDYINNINLNTYINSKNIFLDSNSFFKLTLNNYGNYQILYNDGYLETDTSFQTFMFLTQYDSYVQYKEYELAIRDNLLEAYSYDLSETDYNNVAVRIENYISYAGYGAYYNSGYLLRDYEIDGLGSYAFLDNALKDLGFSSGDVLKISNVSDAMLSYFNSLRTVVPHRNYLLNALKLRLMFGYRFFEGADYYRPLSKILHDSGWFYYEYDLTDYENDVVAREMTKHAFNTLIDKAYIERNGDESIKNQVSELIELVLDGYRDLAEKEDWLDEDTKNGLKRKINNMTYVSCYSDKIKNYPDVDETGLSSLSLVEMYQRTQELLVSLVKNKTIETNYFWSSMPSYTVNAFYSPQNNQFVILNGLLSGGFIGETFEETLGSLGMVIGHEISHSIDENGSKYDEYGQYNNWWSVQSKRLFTEKLNKLKEYYRNVNLFGKTFVNGSRVNTEATADMGGLRVCLEIASEINGFDYDAFFKSFARTWSSMAYDMDRIDEYLEDEHPFDYLRCNVTLAQFDKFQETYNIQPGDGMYIAPEDRIAIW